MSTIKIIGIAVLVIMLNSIFTKVNKEYAFFIRISFAIIVYIMIAGEIGILIDQFVQLSSIVKINNEYIKIVIKIIGIAFLTEIAMSMSKDMGENSVSSNLCIAGKVMIICTASPMIIMLLNNVLELLKI